MKFVLPTSLIAITLLASGVKARWKATPGLTWDYLLGASHSVIEASDRDVVSIDLEEAKKYAPYFHERGQRVVCYFSGGTTENRDDKEDYEKAGIILKGGNGDGWGNNWLDVRNKEKLQPLIRKRFKKAVSYGCDGVEVDCLGIYNYRSEYTKEDSYNFAKWVAETGHEENISVGLKNLASLSPRLEPYFDFAIVESCATSTNGCDYYKAFTSNNKAVFIVHYGNLGYKLSGSILQTLIKEQGGRGFTCVICDHQYLQHNAVNYNCDTGEVIYGKQSKSTVKTTTTSVSTATKAPVSKNSGKCGPGVGSCSAGYCCSKYGYCGTSESYCGSGCQSSYGDCRCGDVTINGVVKRFGKCPSGQCCSHYGHCGVTDSHCKSRCQKEYGICK